MAPLTDRSAYPVCEADVTLPGTVEKIIPAVYPIESDKAQIAIDGAEQLYREIRGRMCCKMRMAMRL